MANLVASDIVSRLKGRTVHVDEECIALGKANNNWHCPQLLALARLLYELDIPAKRLRVTYESMRFSVGEQRFEIPTPPEAEKHQRVLDATRKMAPHEFQIKEILVLQTELRPLSPERIARWHPTPHTREPGRASQRNLAKAVGGL